MHVIWLGHPIAPLGGGCRDGPSGSEGSLGSARLAAPSSDSTGAIPTLLCCRIANFHGLSLAKCLLEVRGSHFPPISQRRSEEDQLPGCIPDFSDSQPLEQKHL